MKVFIIFIIIFLIIFVLAREFWCWYWKINIRIKQINQLNENLEQIKALLIYGISSKENLDNTEDRLPEL